MSPASGVRFGRLGHDSSGGDTGVRPVLGMTGSPPRREERRRCSPSEGSQHVVPLPPRGVDPSGWPEPTGGSGSPCGRIQASRLRRRIRYQNRVDIGTGAPRASCLLRWRFSGVAPFQSPAGPPPEASLRVHHFTSNIVLRGKLLLYSPNSVELVINLSGIDMRREGK